jgi:regulator of sigma E protease
MLGGIIVNVIVGVLIFIGIVYSFGDQYLPMKYVNEHGGVWSLELGQELGLKTGDNIVRINGKEFQNFEDLTKHDVLLSDNSYYTVIRDGQSIDIPVPANFIENFNRRDAAARFLMPRSQPLVETIKDGSVASRVGLKKGDRFVEVNGVSVNYFDEVVGQIRNYTGDSVAFKVQRDGQVLSFKEYYKGETSIGFYVPMELVPPSEMNNVSYSLGQSIVLGPTRAFDVIFSQVKAFKRIFTGQISFSKSLSGPVGMAQAYGGTWDWERFWRMTGLLSMVLAFMNLLPIPGLDGGYVMFLLYEMVSGREPNEKVFETALKVGMAILLVLMVFVFYNDIAKAITGN